jgi:hypothetical protein
MSMHGRRFAIGLVVGVLLGVGVVIASGGLGLSQTEFSPITVQGSVSTTITAATTANTASSTSLPPATTATQGATGPGGNYTLESTVGSPAAAHPVLFGLNSVLSSLPSSKFAAVAAQSPAANAFLVVPILLALVLGVLLYRASTGGRAKDLKDEPAA